MEDKSSLPAPWRKWPPWKLLIPGSICDKFLAEPEGTMTTIAQCLRFLPVEPLKHYIHKRYNNLPWVHKFGLDHIHFQGEVLVIHHSKPGFITLSAGQAEELKQSVKEGRTDSAVLDLLPEDWFRDTTGSGLIDGLLDKVLIPGLFERLTPEKLEAGCNRSGITASTRHSGRST
ncbi:hypothetical protein ACFSQ7_19355 [Paenibacillus rhizoplanae]